MSPDEGPISVVLATDSFLIGDGLAALLVDVDDVKVVGRARDHDELLELVAERDPDAVIISVHTLDNATVATIEAASRLHTENSSLSIVVISDRSNGFALELLRGGAARVAFLLEERIVDMETIVGTLRELHAGQTVLDPSIVNSLVRRRDGIAIDDLTARELDVLEQIAHGLSNPAIAAAFGVSVKAIEKNVTTIFRKLELGENANVDRRVTAALTYLRALDLVLGRGGTNGPIGALEPRRGFVKREAGE